MEKRKNQSNHVKIALAVAVLILLCMAAANFMQRRGFENGRREKKASAPSEPIQKTEFALDTFVSVTLYDSDDAEILDEALGLCRKYEKVFSATTKDSELYRLNHRKENRVEVSTELAEVIAKGLEYGRLSGGAFDISIEPVKALWDFKSMEPVLPDEESIASALSRVDYRRIALEGRTVVFQSSETTIDLGAVAKGYIADKIKEFLEERGVESAIINLGGNVLCIGKKPDGSDFAIGLQMPFADRNETIARLAIDGLSVVSSGVYERHFNIGGKEYHHILDPKTGYPCETGLIGVSIVCPSSADADALSTACFALGAEKGMELIDSMPDACAYFILEDYSILYSEGAKDLVME